MSTHGWAYVFSDWAGDGDYSDPAPHESSGWDSGIAWIIGRDVARSVITIEYRGTTTHTRANDDGWWAFFRVAAEGTSSNDQDVYTAPVRVG